MKRKKYTKQNKEKENIVKESMASYNTPKLGNIFKTITISTLEEQEDEMRRYSASLSHVERMAYLYDLILRAFGHVLTNPSENLWDKTIHIDKK